MNRVQPVQRLSALPAAHPTVNIDSEDLAGFWATSIASEVNRGTVPESNVRIVNVPYNGGAGYQTAVGIDTGTVYFRSWKLGSSSWSSWAKSTTGLDPSSIPAGSITNSASGMTDTGHGGSWLSQRDDGTILLNEVNNQASGLTFRAFVRSKNANKTFVMGRLADSCMGFFVYKNDRVANGTDGYAFLDGVGSWYVSGAVCAVSAIMYTSNLGDWTFYTGITGESKPRFLITNGGTLAWGVGGSTATDTTLTRLSTGELAINTKKIWSENNFDPTTFFPNRKTFVSTADVATDTYLRIGQIALSSGSKDVIVNVRAVTAAGTVTEVTASITFAWRNDNYASMQVGATTLTSHSYNTETTAENGWVLRYLRLSWDVTAGYAYLDVNKYVAGSITITVSPLTPNSWTWTEGTISASATAGGTGLKSMNLGYGLRATSMTADSAASSTYSVYGVLLGRTLTNTDNKTGLWMYLGYVQLDDNSSYRSGRHIMTDIRLTELAADSTVTGREDFVIRLRVGLGAYADGTAFNAAIPNVLVEVEGNTTLSGSDFAALVSATSTTGKTIKLYVKLKSNNTHYDIAPVVGRYGASYNSSLGHTTNYCAFYGVTGQATVASLPTPAQGSVTYGVIRESLSGDVNAPGTSTGWGMTPTTGYRTVMGVAESATWLCYGTSNGTLRGGVQVFDAGGEARLYGGANYLHVGATVTYNGSEIVHASNLNTMVFGATDRAFAQLPKHGLRPDQIASTAIGARSMLYSAIGSGRSLFHDEEFASGTNSVGIYNNAGGTSVTLTREADATAPNRSGYRLKITYDGTTSPAPTPGLGGFVQLYTHRANAVIVQRFLAKIPVGYSVNNNENSVGTNGQVVWLTSREGTGKWEEYIRMVYCGDSGTFGLGGHVRLSGSGAVTWYLASCNAYEITTSGVAELYALMASHTHKQNHSLHYYYGGTLTTAEKQPVHRIPFAGAITRVGYYRDNTTYPTSNATIVIKKNGTSIYTVTIGTTDAHQSFILTSSSSTAVAVGDRIEAVVTGAGATVSDITIQIDIERSTN